MLNQTNTVNIMLKINLECICNALECVSWCFKLIYERDIAKNDRQILLHVHKFNCCKSNSYDKYYA